MRRVRECEPNVHVMHFIIRYICTVCGKIKQIQRCQKPISQSEVKTDRSQRRSFESPLLFLSLIGCRFFRAAEMTCDEKFIEMLEYVRFITTRRTQKQRKKLLRLSATCFPPAPRRRTHRLRSVAELPSVTARAVTVHKHSNASAAAHIIARTQASPLPAENMFSLNNCSATEKVLCPVPPLTAQADFVPCPPPRHPIHWLHISC